jgi:hypothetical protein
VGFSPRPSTSSPPRTRGDAILAPANQNGRPGLPGPCGIPPPAGNAAHPGTAATKYTCPDCEQNAWAKPGAHLVCGDCDRPMISQATEQSSGNRGASATENGKV